MTAQEFLEQLWVEPIHNYGWYDEIIKSVAESDDAGYLYDLALALTQAKVPTNAPEHKMGDVYGVFHTIISRLAKTRGEIQIETLMRVLLLGQEHPGTSFAVPNLDMWPLPMIIAREHDPEMIDVAAAAYAREAKLGPMFGEAASELIGFGTSLNNYPALLSAYEERLKALSLPTDKLPPALYGIEQGLITEYPPELDEVFRIGVINRETVVPQATGTALDLTATMDIPNRESMLRAFEPWFTESNGISDVHVFTSADEINPEQIGAVMLRALGIKSASANPIIKKMDAQSAFAIVYQGAMGGAYGDHPSSAWRRFATWETLSAVAGVDRSASNETRNKVINETLWFNFKDAGDWFYLYAWDVGLVALRPDRKTLVVLAVTDTD